MAKIMLAPMEGVVDANMRHLLTGVGGIDTCVTEFIRITGQKLPTRDLLKKVPELLSGGRTSSQVPVVVQFLGSDPQMLAYHAHKVVGLGALAVDLNFGCPSKTVNKHGGGAALLDDPETLYKIVREVRGACASHIPVSAKMRLGNKDKSLALENACALQSAGVSSIVVHARTKIEGYRPPAHWEWIRKIRESVNVNVIANGDITCWQDYLTCREVSGCEDVMIGRALLANPALALSIKQRSQGTPVDTFDWADTLLLINNYYLEVQRHLDAPFVPGRVKQWLNMMRKVNPQAQQLFDSLKKSTQLCEISAHLEVALTAALAQRGR